MAKRWDTQNQTLRLLKGHAEKDGIYRKNGTDCVGANAKKKKKINWYRNEWQEGLTLTQDLKSKLIY